MRRMGRAGGVRTGVKIYAENGGGPRRAAEKVLLLGGFAALPAPYQAPQTVLQTKRTEIQQQPDLAAAHPQVGEQLRLMLRHKPFDGLDFHDHILIDQQIGPKAGVQTNATIRNRNRGLPAERNSRRLSVQTQGRSHKPTRAIQAPVPCAQLWPGR